MFTVEQNTPTGGDETRGFKITLDKEYTVKSLLDTILTIKEEWGDFSVIGGSKCKYSHGNLLSELNKKDLNKKVKSVWAWGGWSLMSYFVYVK